MNPKVIDVTSASEIEESSTDEEITTVVEQIVCKMKTKDEDKRKKKDLSNVKAEDIIEDKPNKNVVAGKEFAKLTKKNLETFQIEKIVSILLLSKTERRYISELIIIIIIIFIS